MATPGDCKHGAMDLHRSVGLEPSTLRRADIAAATGADPERTIRWWRAMGFPEVADDTVAFNELDLDLVMRVAELEDAGLVDDDDIARLARLLGARYWVQTHGTDVWNDRRSLTRRLIEAADMVSAERRPSPVRHVSFRRLVESRPES